MRGATWLGSLLVLAVSVAARSATGDRVLVVLEPQVDKEDYSNFWSSLEERGFELEFKSPKDESAQLSRYGVPQYDHLIMFTPSTKAYTTSLSPKEVIAAQFQGLNTLYLLSPNMSEINRDTFREYDLEFAERDFTYIDAFSHPQSSPSSTVLLPPASCLVRNPGPILSKTTLTGAPIVFPSGTVHSVGRSPYLVEVAHGTKTGYVAEDRAMDDDEAEVEASLGKKDGVQTGKKAGLVSAMQTRDNVRIGFVGSGAMFSNEWWKADIKTIDGKTETTGNAGFAEDLTKWLFQETGVVKIVSTAHHRKGESEPKELYRIKDDLTYSVSLAQHTTTEDGDSAWAPFSVSDLQMDFTMLDPHIRTAMIQNKTASNKDQTTYSATFKAPDRHGVFKFVVEYWRPGWSYIRTSSTASVVPFRHNEYLRFITGAWPFYSSAASTSVAFLLFCALWITIGDVDRKGKKKAE